MTPKATKPTEAAERMRRYRRRRRQGVLVVRAEVSTDVLNALITTGWLTADEAQNADAVGKAIGKLTESWAHDSQKIRYA